MQLILHPVKLFLKHPFKIAHGTFTYRNTLIVELKEGNLSGYGEATAISYYGTTLEHFIEMLKNYQSKIEQYQLEEPTKFWQYCYSFFKNDPFILCALDVAAHDLWAKKLGKPLYRAWGLPLDKTPLTNFTISIGSVEEMLRQMQNFQSPVYKIKLGTKDDLKLIKALRQQSKALFRVDANGAWTVEETLKNAAAFKELGVEFIEQPLPKDAWEAMEILYKKSPLPIIADESCQVESDVVKCKNRFHGINIKLMKCGGFTPALRMIQMARSLNMKLMCGCMTESSIGISAIAQLLPLLDYVDMDGALLLKKDPATGVKIRQGEVIFSGGNGIGAKIGQNTEFYNEC